MKVALTAEQSDWIQALRRMFAKECQPALARELRQSGDAAATTGLWEALGRMGVFGVGLPEESNRAGADFFELGLFFREAGRVLCPTLVYSTIAFRLGIQGLGAVGQRDWLGRVAAGEVRASVALWDPSDFGDIHPRLVARQRDGVWSLSGSVEFVSNADLVDVLLVSASDASEPWRFLAFLVYPGQSGVRIERHRTLGRDVQCRVTFDDAPIADAGDVVGRDGTRGHDDGLRWVSNAAMALQCMEMVGGAEAVLDRTVDYVKERHQFGRPIASFQAAQHHVANMDIAIIGARLAAYQATWLVGRDEPVDRAVAIAKLKCNEAYKWATLTAHQLHGGMGFVRESDLHLWSERAKAAELLGGAGDVQLGRLSRLLGMEASDAA